MTQLPNFQAKTISGQDFPMESLQGKAVLVVNTASACGFTPQLTGLQALHEEFGPQGLVVLGFPCNQFGSQDPGSNDEIGAFCQANYGVTFTMMDKVEVNGAQAHPLFQWLKTQAPGLLGSEGIKWNFTKFLLNRQGDVVKRYAPLDKPASLAQDIAEVLKQS
jgi:glutathione peroxidase